MYKWNEFELTQITEKEKAQKIHNLKVQNIRKAIDNSYPFSYRTKIPQYKSPLKLISKVKTEDNMRIYKRLADISVGRIYKTKDYESPESYKYYGKSLNSTKRRDEAKRIASQNMLLYRKLASQESNLSKKKLEKQYQSFVSYKQRISKTKRSEHLQRLAKKRLVPLMLRCSSVMFT